VAHTSWLARPTLMSTHSSGLYSQETRGRVRHWHEAMPPVSTSGQVQ
jgi:hypothetical protein